MSCKRKSFSQTKICSGDLRHRLTLQLRQAGGSYDDTSIQYTFVDLGKYWAGIETVRGTRRFQGVAIDQSTTHMVWIRYAASIEIPEDGNHFFQLSDGRRLRVIRSTIDGEDSRYLMIECSERGDGDKEASQS